MYKLMNDFNGDLAGIHRMTDSAMIPLDPANSDYAAYLEWLDEGNTPEPADTE